MRWWRKRVSFDTRKDGFDGLMKAVDDPNTSIQMFTMSFDNPGNKELPVTSEGWGIDLLTAVWRKARAANAGRATLLLSEAKTAELWSCEIIMTAPNFHKGWRKVTNAIGRWLIGL